MNIIIIGGGAAGMMCAAVASEANPDAKITLIEKNPMLGRKVLISGGGRCNVTTGIGDIKKVMDHYPRGKNFLKFAMYEFPPKVVYKWMEDRGAKLTTESDLRVFPSSNKGTSIVALFEQTFYKNHVTVLTKTHVDTITNIKKNNNSFEKQFIVHTRDGLSLSADKLVLTTGGSAYNITGSTGDGYRFAETLGHRVTPLAPSLNAFIFKETWIQRVAGVSFPKARLTFHGSKKYTFSGPFLFTHAGITGPAVFALSSLCAYEMYDKNHPAPLFIDLMTDLNFDQLLAEIQKLLTAHPKKIFVNILDMIIPKSLAEIVCGEFNIEKKHGNEMSKAELRKITQWLKHLPVNVIGRASGEEFVTAGGIDLSQVDSQTMQSKICPNLYFAGEILDIDGFTGGFNLQAAWATGRLAGLHVSITAHKLS